MTRNGATPEDVEALEGGRLAENIMHFARVLRAAGLPVGPGQVLDGIEAVQAAGIGRRSDFYWTLHSVFVTSRQQRALFDQAFHLFWRKPELIEQMMAMLLPEIAAPARPHDSAPAQTRVAEAMFGGVEPPKEHEAEEIVEVEASLTYSRDEVLRDKDFEQMTSEEQALAKRAIARLDLTRTLVPTRRFRPDARGARIDMRRSLRASLRLGGSVIALERKARRWREPPIVALCDISGSMTQYSRMLLHFLHALSGDRDRVHVFVFGTRLTNITRHLRTKDVDEALEAVSGAVDDWSGGTRIGACLKEFNFTWARRCLGQGAQVLLITDGLDRDMSEHLELEIERLHLSCRSLVWLNPLLRYDGFEPKAAGIRTMLPHVDRFETVHNLASLEHLADALSGRVSDFTGLANAG
jgi:hypothetical protein